MTGKLTVDLGYRGREIDGVQVLHRGKPKSLTRRQWAWVKRRQAIEPVIGHLKRRLPIAPLSPEGR